MPKPAKSKKIARSNGSSIRHSTRGRIDGGLGIAEAGKYPAPYFSAMIVIPKVGL